MGGLLLDVGQLAAGCDQRPGPARDGAQRGEDLVRAQEVELRWRARCRPEAELSHALRRRHLPRRRRDEDAVEDGQWEAARQRSRQEGDLLKASVEGSRLPSSMTADRAIGFYWFRGLAPPI